MNITKASDIQTGDVLVMGPVRLEATYRSQAGIVFGGWLPVLFEHLQALIDQGATVERLRISPEKRRELINEVLKLDKPPFERGLEVWYVHRSGSVAPYEWTADVFDVTNYRQGRIYATEEEAIAAAPKLLEAWGE